MSALVHVPTTDQVKVLTMHRKNAEYVLVAHADPSEDLLVFELNVAPCGRELSGGAAVVDQRHRVVLNVNRLTERV